jgi:hypothetical protein
MDPEPMYVSVRRCIHLFSFGVSIVIPRPFDDLEVERPL